MKGEVKKPFFHFVMLYRFLTINKFKKKKISQFQYKAN